MPEALVVDIQLAAPPPGSREQLVDRPPPPGSRAAKLARLKELRAKYGHINSDAAAPPVTSPVRRAEPAVTFEPRTSETYWISLPHLAQTDHAQTTQSISDFRCCNKTPQAPEAGPDSRLPDAPLQWR